MNSDLKLTGFKGTLLAFASVAALFLSGCVQSEKPLVADAKPLMGDKFEVHFYEDFVDGKANALHTASYQWTGKNYVLVRGSNDRVKSFVGVVLDQDNFLVEGVYKGSSQFSYWIARKMVDGAYLIVPVDEDDADDAMRSAACSGKKVEGQCFVETEENIIKLAKATASKTLRHPTLGVLILRRDGV